MSDNPAVAEAEAILRRERFGRDIAHMTLVASHSFIINIAGILGMIEGADGDVDTARATVVAQLRQMADDIEGDRLDRWNRPSSG